MKLLSVFFLVGLALCYAVPVEDAQELSVDEVQELDFLLAEVLDEQRSSRNVKETLKNMFDRLMEKVTDMTGKGKEVNSGLVDRIKNVLEKLKDKGIDLQDKIRERGGNLPEKAKDLWKKFLERLGIGEKLYDEGQRSTRNVKETLKNMFDRLMEKVAEMTEKGKEVNSGLVDKVRNVLEKLKDKGINLQDKIRDRGGNLPEKAKELWNKFMERLGIGEKAYDEGQRSTRDAKETLKNMFDRILEMIKDSAEKGKEISEGLAERIKNLYERAKKLGINLKEHIKERGGGLSGKARELFNKFLEKIGIEGVGEEDAEFAEGNLDIQRDEQMIEYHDHDHDHDHDHRDGSGEDGIKGRLGRTFRRFLDNLKGDLESRRGVSQRLVEKMRDMVRKMKDVGIRDYEIRGKFRDLSRKLNDKGKDALDKLMSRLGIRRSKRMIELAGDGNLDNQRDEQIIEYHDHDHDHDHDHRDGSGEGGIKERLGRTLRRFLDNLKDDLESRRGVSQRSVEKMRDMIRKMKDVGVRDYEIRGKFRDLSRKLNDRGKDALDKLMSRLGIRRSKRMIEFDDGQNEADEDAKKRFEKILNKQVERLRRYLEKGRKIRQSIVDRVKDMLEKMKKIGMEESEINGKFTDLMGKLSEKGKEGLKKLVEKLGIKRDERMIEYHDHNHDHDHDHDHKDGSGEGGIKDRLGRTLRRFLDSLKDDLESRRGVSQRSFEKIRDMIRKMKDVGVRDYEIRGKFRDLSRKLNERGRNTLDKLMSRLGINKSKRMIEFADDGDEGEDNGVKGRLGRILQQFLDKLKNVLEKNRGISQRIVDRMKDMIKRMKNFGIGESDITGKFSDLFKKLSDKGKEALDRLMKRLGLKREESMTEFADDGENPEISKDIREKFEELLQKIKDAIENGRSLRDGLEQLKEIRERLKDLRVKLGDKAKELVEKLREKIREYFQKLMEKFNRKEERSLKEVYENIKEYLKNLQIDLKERFVKFGEWAKEKFEKGLEKGRDRTETLKKLAREFIDDAKVISRDVAEEAKEFFQEYKGDLGVIYDRVREKVREILDRQD